MAEYIEREAVLAMKYGGVVDVVDIKAIPAADVAPVVHCQNLYGKGSSLFECSVCHWSDGDTMTGDTSDYNFCPNCGAKVDGERKDGAKDG